MDAYLFSVITPEFEYFYSLQSQMNSNPWVFLPLTLSTFTHSRVKSTQTPEYSLLSNTAKDYSL